jgi:hypothetical protein
MPRANKALLTTDFIRGVLQRFPFGVCIMQNKINNVELSLANLHSSLMIRWTEMANLVMVSCFGSEGKMWCRILPRDVRQTVGVSWVRRKAPTLQYSPPLKGQGTEGPLRRNTPSTTTASSTTTATISSTYSTTRQQVKKQH